MLLKTIAIFLLSYFLCCDFSWAKNVKKDCLPIKKIVLQSNSILQSDNQIFLDAKQQCFKQKNIDNLLKKINNFYSEKGYILATANFTFFDYNKNILHLKINEIKISDILFAKVINQQHHIFFQNFINKIFNIFELNYALQKFNKITNLNAQIKIIQQ